MPPAFLVALLLGSAPMASAAPADGVTVERPVVFLTPFLPKALSAERVAALPLSGVLPPEQGSDLCIRYPDGHLRNLTAEAMANTHSAAGAGEVDVVRDPTVSWTGHRVVFSLARMNAPAPPVFQLYELTGIEEGGVASMRRLDGQPEANNNTSAVFLADDSVLFLSDAEDAGSPLATATPGIWQLHGNGYLEFQSFWSGGAFDLRYDTLGQVHTVPRVTPRWRHEVVERIVRQP